MTLSIRTARREKPVRFIEIPEDQRKWVEACKLIMEITGERPVIKFHHVGTDTISAKLILGNRSFLAGDVIYREPSRTWGYCADIDHFLETFEVTE